MRNVNFRKRLFAFLAAVAVFCSIFAGGSIVNAEEQQGALGTQQPAITASYTDAEGNVCDGNALAPGSYKMTISVSDLYSFAIVQFSASFDTEKLSVSSVGTLLSQNIPQTAGYFLPTLSGNLEFFIYSQTYGDATVLQDNRADLLVVDITVLGDSAVDIQDIITVDQHPSETFIDVNYGDYTVAEDGTSVYNCYALSDADDFTGTVYSMTCDLSPDLTNYYNVSAYVGALSSPDDEYGTYATTGATVSINLEDGTLIQAVTDENGKFVLENVPNGEYNATITYKYGFDRTFKIVVDGADIDSDIIIGIVACNWDQTNFTITATDLAVYSEHSGETVDSPSYDLGIDINRSNNITATDMSIYAQFAGLSSESFEYADIVITN